jgi:hypothetical protein
MGRGWDGRPGGVMFWLFYHPEMEVSVLREGRGGVFRLKFAT